MPAYSISDIEKLSGVKAHTIRIWEKRYEIIPTRRSETNIRYYNDEDLQHILNIAFLNKQGYKISAIAKLTSKQITDKVAELCNIEENQDNLLDGLLLSMYELNEHKFLKIINHKIADFGFEKTMESVLYPYLDKLSQMWIKGSIKNVHENFITSIIRRKLSVEIDKLDPIFNPDAKRFLLYLPDNELHELSLLFIYYILRKNGANVCYLGAQVNFIDMVEAVNIYEPHFVFTLFNDSFAETPLQPYLDDMKEYVPDTHIIISGYQTVKQNIKDTENITVVHNFNEVKTLLINKFQTEITVK